MTTGFSGAAGTTAGCGLGVTAGGSGTAAVRFEAAPGQTLAGVPSGRRSARGASASGENSNSLGRESSRKAPFTGTKKPASPGLVANGSHEQSGIGQAREMACRQLDIRIGEREPFACVASEPAHGSAVMPCHHFREANLVFGRQHIRGSESVLAGDCLEIIHENDRFNSARDPAQEHSSKLRASAPGHSKAPHDIDIHTGDNGPGETDDYGSVRGGPVEILSWFGFGHCPHRTVRVILRLWPVLCMS